MSENKFNSKDYNKLWETTDAYDPNFYPDVEKGFKQFKSKINQPQLEVLMKRKSNYLLRYAASLALVIGLGLGVYYSFPKSEIVEIVADSKIKTTLPDGSIIFQQEDSKVTYKKGFSGKTRTVSLDGIAYFEVAHNKEKPFIVETEQGIVKVLGTTFMVDASTDFTSVQVTSGIVSLRHPSQHKSLALRKGMKATSCRNYTLPKLDNRPDQNDLAWHTKEFYFNNKTIDEILDKLSKYYKVKLKLTSPEIGACHFTTKFELSKDIKELIESNPLFLNYEIKPKFELDLISLDNKVKACY